MCATVAKSPQSIVLFDIPWNTYTKMFDALPQHPLRHSYAEGTLEMFVSPIVGVPWSAYTRVLNAFGDRRLNHTYQDGTLEIMMSPSEDHERIKSFLGRVIELTALELGITYQALGSTTQRDKKLMQGIEPDESYLIPFKKLPARKGASRSSTRQTPTLMIEVDLRKADLDRMESFAKLGVREVWRYRKGRVEFWELVDGAYCTVESSQILKVLTAADVTHFVQTLVTSDDGSVTREFLTWLRRHSRKR